MNLNVIILLLLVIQKILAVSGYRILVLSPATAPSHTNFFKPVVRELAERGHQVTYWNGLKMDNFGQNTNQTTNLKMIFSSEIEQMNSDHKMKFDDHDSPMRLLLTIPSRIEFYCKHIYKDSVFHQLMNSNDKYDLIIVEAVFNECVLPLVRKFDVPFVYMMGLAPSPWLLDAVGSSLAFDHVPHPGSNYRNQMNLWQRTYNTFSGMILLYFYRFFVIPMVDRLTSEMLKLDNLTSVSDIESEYLSLAIVNTHFSINYQFPTSPALIQAGGLHCVASKPLPEEMESFVQGSADAGFIIVSFGSILKGADIPVNVRSLFLSTFSRLSQRVLWKWEKDEHGDNNDSSIPPNVKLVSWLPQQDLLGHSKIRLFITHGGLFSNQEAVYHGVPLIVLPVFADQPINAQKAEDDGYAIRLDWDSLTQEILFDAIHRILSDSRYGERMNHVSTVMRDQMESPLERAVYWIEYVIRHGGASHLRASSRKLSLYQRCLFDVMLLVLVVGFFACYTIILLGGYSLKRCKVDKPKISKDKKKKN